MKTIRMKIKDGKFRVETSGYAGESCREATAKLEQRLGVKLTDEPTAEMSEQQEAGHEHAD